MLLLYTTFSDTWLYILYLYATLTDFTSLNQTLTKLYILCYAFTQQCTALQYQYKTRLFKTLPLPHTLYSTSLYNYTIKQDGTKPGYTTTSRYLTQPNPTLTKHYYSLHYPTLLLQLVTTPDFTITLQLVTTPSYTITPPNGTPRHHSLPLQNNNSLKETIQYPYLARLNYSIQ